MTYTSIYIKKESGELILRGGTSTELLTLHLKKKKTLFLITMYIYIIVYRIYAQ